MNTLDKTVDGIRLHGRYDSAFASVVDEFVNNFATRNEVGGSVCLSVDGKQRLDLWGGHVDEARSAPWREDTVSVVFSCTKGATALCAHLLIDRGLLDLQAPVAKYWPTFAHGAKEKTTVTMMLNHSAGLPAFREPIKQGGYYDWDYMIERLEKEEPFWEPGTRNGYHMISFGWWWANWSDAPRVNRWARSFAMRSRSRLAWTIGSGYQKRSNHACRA